MSGQILGKRSPDACRNPLRPPSPPGFRPDGRNGLPENRRDGGELEQAEKKAREKMNQMVRIWSKRPEA
jgi:hypothetical protein